MLVSSLSSVPSRMSLDNVEVPLPQQRISYTAKKKTAKTRQDKIRSASVYPNSPPALLADSGFRIVDSNFRYTCHTKFGAHC
jgi:hypothetical protein